MEQNISKLKFRILQFAEYKEYSKRKIYQDTGISNGVLDKSTGLTESNIERFISTYQEVSLVWFLTGKGAMFKKDAGENVPKTISKNYKELADARKEIIDHLKNEIDRLEDKVKKLKKEKTSPIDYRSVAEPED